MEQAKSQRLMLGLVQIVLSPRFLTEPRWQEERRIRVNTVCLQQFHQFIRFVQHAFRHDWFTTFVRTFFRNVTAISSPRCIRFSSSESAQTRRPSARNLTRNSKEKQNQHVNTTHYTRRLYILFCKSLSAQLAIRIPQYGPLIAHTTPLTS